MADKISITICGDGGCGKSSITLRLVRSQWTHEYDPTIEDSYSVTRTIDGLTYHLSLTDTAGQEEYRSLWGPQNLHSDAFLLVYDITSASSLPQLQYYMDMIDIESEARKEEADRLRLQGKGDKARAVPIKLVAGNKCDLKNSRQVSSKEGLDWARSRGSGFMETSAREMVNIEETFALIVRRVVEARTQTANGGRMRLSPLDPRSHNTSQNPSPQRSLVPPFENNAISQTQPLSPLAEKQDCDLDRRKGTGARLKDWFGRLFACGR